MRSVRNVGRRRAEGARPDRPLTASSLLACPDPERILSAAEGEIPVPVGLLSDLHDPRLIITTDYVGPDRRLLDRREWRSLEQERTRYRAWPPATTSRPSGRVPSRRAGSGRVGSGRVGSATSLRVRHLVAAVLLTAVTVVPLTVLVTHRGAPTVPGAPTTPAAHPLPHPAPGTPVRP